MADFDYGILDATAHRPWPMPDSPWIMTQSWHELLFAHWPVEPQVLRQVVPSVFPLDLHHGNGWLGIVAFHMTNVAPRGIPTLPWLSAFPELNVRTYVTMEGKPGVWFLSLDAANPLAVRAARRVFHLPYFSATMTVESADGVVRYNSRRTDRHGPSARFVGRYRPTAAARAPTPGTLDHFLTERYCLYTLNRRGEPLRLEIHHPPWPLQPAELILDTNTMAAAARVPLPMVEPLLHFAGRQDIVAWPLSRPGPTPRP